MAADTTTCLIIGGGLAGLMAAVTLQRRGLHPIVLDKGYGIGGRLASRRVRSNRGNIGLFDYGAQQFTVGTPTFQSWVDDWLQQGIVRTWSQGFADATGGFRQSDHPHYCGVVSNRAIAQHLAQTLEIHQPQQVTRLDWQGEQWVAYTESAQTFSGDVALLTPPLPQTLGLLALSHIPIPDDVAPRLQIVTYAPCIAVLALLAQESAIPAPGGLYLNGEPLQWLASNSQKGISPGGYGVTLHGGPRFSQAYWEADNAAIAAHLIAAAQPWLNAPVMAHHVHRWKYSQPLQRFGDAFTQINRPGPLFLAGDAFAPEAAASTLEGAALSGLAAARAIADAYR
ncbi:MAG: FAD-dependent oxidoreductase [Cyanobacteria bacterium]|nr:FAD-dependent oxidoreductase [Cyanobacteriota bacterium]